MMPTRRLFILAATIAMLAVVLSFVGNCGDNAKTDAIIKTNEAANKWSHFQAKSVKGQLSEMQVNLIETLGGSAATEKAAHPNMPRRPRRSRTACVGFFQRIFNPVRAS